MPTPSPLALPSTAGILSRLVCARLLRAGRDLAPILAQAGLTLAQIDDPKVRLEARAQVKLAEIAAEELKDDWLGYHLAREYEPAATGLLHYVLASAENLADALSKAERYTRIVHEGIALTYTIANTVVIALEDVGVERVLDRQQIEFMLFGLVRACRIFTDTRLAPLRLTIRHVHDGAPPDLRAFLGCDITFGADADSIILRGSAAALPFAKADPHLNRLLTEYAEAALAHRTPHKGSFRARVEKEIAPLLPHGKARAKEVARQLGTSPRSMTRSLAGEGLTFSVVLEQFRRDLAKAYLNDPDLSIS